MLLAIAILQLAVGRTNIGRRMSQPKP